MIFIISRMPLACKLLLPLRRMARTIAIISHGRLYAGGALNDGQAVLPLLRGGGAICAFVAEFVSATLLYPLVFARSRPKGYSSVTRHRPYT